MWGVGDKDRLGVLATKTDSGVLPKQTQATDTSQELTKDPVDPHHINKALVAVGALALVGLVVWART